MILPLARLLRRAMRLRRLAVLPLFAALPAAAQIDVTSTPLYDLVRAMPSNSWAKANQNAYSDVWTPVQLRTLYDWVGLPAPDKIIRAWSGFAWDTTRGDLILWGGGHANYSGNDVYRWRSSTLRWERASLPSAITYLQPSTFNAIDGPDAAPVAAHTYDNNTYLPLADRFLTFGGAAYQTGTAWHRWTDATETALRITGPYLWNPNRADPMRVGGTTGSHPQHSGAFPDILGGTMWFNRDLPADFANTPFEHVNGCAQTVVEEGRDTVYVAARRGGTPLVLFRWQLGATPDDDTFSRVGGYWATAAGQTTCGYWPERKLFVYTATGSNPLVFWDLTNPGATNYNKHVNVAGLQTLVNGLAAKGMAITNCALKFDPVRRNFVLWCGDSTLWRIMPPATNATTGWSVQQIEGGGTAPVKIIGTGLLGKWKYAPGYDVFVGLMDPNDGSVWVYKPAGWVDPAIGTPPANRPPTVDPTATPSQPRPGATVTFSANAADTDGTIASVRWTFGDGQQLSGTTVTRSFAAAGSYSAQVSATDDDGATATASLIFTVTANATPTVSASATPTSAPTGLPIAFAASAADHDGTISSIRWTFGDGASALGSSVSHAYAATGTYTARVTVTDDEGATATDSVAVTVTAGPGAGDVMVQLRQGGAGYAGATDTYLDRYVPNAVRSGSTLLNVDPAYFTPLLRFAVFQAEGGPVPNGAEIVSAELALYKRSVYDQVYRLQRILVPWQAGQATWTQRLTGVAWASGGAQGAATDIDAAPDAQASAGWDPAAVRFDVTARLRAWSTQSRTGPPANHGWRVDWAGGNGNRAYFDSAETAGGTPQRPMLTIRYRSTAAANQPPRVTASASPTSATAGVPVVFSAVASDPDGTIATIAWTFGDGGTASAANVSHAYSGAGSYTATVTVYDDDGASASTSVNVNVVANMPPTVDATATPATAQTGQAIAFAAAANDGDGSIASIRWTFGDGTSASGARVSKAFASAGSYAVRVVVTDDGGATASDTVIVTVTQAPVPGTEIAVSLRQGQSGYAGVTDTYLDRYVPGTNWNRDTVLNISAGHFAPLLRFAIFAVEGGPVPDGAQIVSAELVLFKRSVYNQGYRLQRVLVPWQATQATWNQRLTGVAWSLPGALGAGTDVDAVPDDAVSAGWEPALVRFDVTSRLQAWSTQAQAGTIANHGWRIGWTSGNTNRAYFDSNETNLADVQRPMLSITYRQP